MPTPASMTNESTCTERLMTLYCPKSSMLRRFASSLLMAKEQSMMSICMENVHTTSRPIPELSLSLMTFSMPILLFESDEAG